MTQTIRSYVADQVRADNPDWTVHGYPMVPANVKRDQAVVSVWRSDIEPGPTDLGLRHPVTVNLYGAKTTDEAAEHELDGLHDALLVSLQRLQMFTWTRSTRSTFRNGTLTGWQITGYVTTENIYRSAVLKERTP